MISVMADSYSEESPCFVEDLPQEFKCGICLDVLNNAHLTTCCGHHFCQRTCYERVKSTPDKKPCPMCSANSEKFLAFPDLNIQRRIRQLEVYCPNKADTDRSRGNSRGGGCGCNWKGVWSELSEHLCKKCEFRQVACPNYCGAYLDHSVVQEHREKDCPNRTWVCQHCSEILQHKEQADHLASDCSRFPELCPAQGCGVTVPRCSMKEHFLQCPMQVIQCKYAYTGCKTAVQRKDMPAHTSDAVQSHLKQVHDHFSQRLSEQQLQLAEAERRLSEKSKLLEDLGRKLLTLESSVGQKLAMQKLEFEKKLNDMTQQFLKLQIQNLPANVADVGIGSRVSVLESLVPVPPFYFSMSNVALHKRAKTPWCSPVFYTQLKGYKLTVQVSVAGEGAGRDSCVSVFVHVMRGEFDHVLPWPLRASVTIQMVSQSSDNHFERTSPELEWEQVVSRGMAGAGKGWERFFPYQDLEYNPSRDTEYLKGDQLSFRVILVDVHT